MVKKAWLKRVLLIALVVEFAYVVLFNLALQLPVTQVWLNQVKPDKFIVNWESAWTWYPFRFHFKGASGNGQSRSQQWEFESQAVSASIDVLPLIFKRVWINHVRLSDTSYSQRPRLKPGRDYKELIPFYPTIGEREISNAVTTPGKNKRAWHIDIEDIRLDGHYQYWVHRFRGQASGTMQAGLDAVSRGGLFSIRIPQFDLRLRQHFSGESQEVFQQGEMAGKLEFVPFIPRENKGINLLRFLLIDADLGIDIKSLGFIDPIIRKYKHLEIDGAGRIDGHLTMEKGRALAGTDLSVGTEQLNVNLVSHDISGNGAIRIKASPDSADRLDLDVRFNDMVVNQAGADRPLLTGQGLALTGNSDNVLIQAVDNGLSNEPNGLNNKMKQVELNLKIPTARVADMSSFNYYIPPGAPLAFTSGTAELEADISLDQEGSDGFLRLNARGMEAQVDNQSIRADLSASILVMDGTLDELNLDVSGSQLKLENVTVAGDQESFDQENWAATLTLEQAEAILIDPFRIKTEASLHMTDSRPIVAVLGNQKGSPRWVKRMLTIEDVIGRVLLDFENPRLVIPNASMHSDNIELHGRGVINEDGRNGVIYARYKKLDIVMKISEGKRNIDLFRARQKFDEFQLPAGLR
jgi:hypothetical protein